MNGDRTNRLPWEPPNTADRLQSSRNQDKLRRELLDGQGFSANKKMESLGRIRLEFLLMMRVTAELKMS